MSEPQPHESKWLPRILKFGFQVTVAIYDCKSREKLYDDVYDFVKRQITRPSKKDVKPAKKLKDKNELTTTEEPLNTGNSDVSSSVDKIEDEGHKVEQPEASENHPTGEHAGNVGENTRNKRPKWKRPFKNESGNENGKLLEAGDNATMDKIINNDTGYSKNPVDLLLMCLSLGIYAGELIMLAMAMWSTILLNPKRYKAQPAKNNLRRAPSKGAKDFKDQPDDRGKCAENGANKPEVEKGSKNKLSNDIDAEPPLEDLKIIKEMPSQAVQAMTVGFAMMELLKTKSKLPALDGESKTGDVKECAIKPHEQYDADEHYQHEVSHVADEIQHGEISDLHDTTICQMKSSKQEIGKTRADFDFNHSPDETPRQKYDWYNSSAEQSENPFYHSDSQSYEGEMQERVSAEYNCAEERSDGKLTRYADEVPKKMFSNHTIKNSGKERKYIPYTYEEERSNGIADSYVSKEEEGKMRKPHQHIIDEELIEPKFEYRNSVFKPSERVSDNSYRHVKQIQQEKPDHYKFVSEKEKVKFSHQKCMEKMSDRRPNKYRGSDKIPDEKVDHYNFEDLKQQEIDERYRLVGQRSERKSGNCRDEHASESQKISHYNHVDKNPKRKVGHSACLDKIQEQKVEEYCGVSERPEWKADHYSSVDKIPERNIDQYQGLSVRPEMKADYHNSVNKATEKKSCIYRGLHEMPKITTSCQTRMVDNNAEEKKVGQYRCVDKREERKADDYRGTDKSLQWKAVQHKFVEKIPERKVDHYKVVNRQIRWRDDVHSSVDRSPDRKADSYKDSVKVAEIKVPQQSFEDKKFANENDCYRYVETRPQYSFVAKNPEKEQVKFRYINRTPQEMVESYREVVTTPDRKVDQYRSVENRPERKFDQYTTGRNIPERKTDQNRWSEKVTDRRVTERKVTERKVTEKKVAERKADEVKGCTEVPEKKNVCYFDIYD